MSGLINALLISAVVALVVVRQFRARRISADRSWWVVPAVLIFLAVREPGLLDPHHRTGAALLLGAELLTGLAIGAGWAWTTHMWTEADGTVWSRSTRASAAVWIVGMAVRAGLFGAGVLLGIRQDSSALLLALAATLLVRSGLLLWRASSLRPPYENGAAYGVGAPRPVWKGRV
jgi:hypothetical protein